MFEIEGINSVKFMVDRQRVKTYYGGVFESEKSVVYLNLID